MFSSHKLLASYLFASLSSMQENEDEIEISPVKRPSTGGIIPSVILGVGGIEKLGLRVDLKESLLYPVVQTGLII